jgi:hypothetical protein
MVEFFLMIVFSILNVVVPYAIIRNDRTRLDAEQRARAWNHASFACAIYFFGPLSLPAHFWITRRKPAALLQGALWTTLVLSAEWLLGTILEQALT